MKNFSAQYIITNTGPLLKRGIVTTDDDGTVVAIHDTGGSLEENQSIEFYNGILIPGFVNCHCHIELSHMKGSIARKGRLGSFIEKVRTTRDTNSENITDSIYQADRSMFKEGIVSCADICNTSLSFSMKRESIISYTNLLEVFGTDPDKAGHRMEEINKVAIAAKSMNLPFSFVPHAVYSTSLPLFRLLRKQSENNTVTSIHFMETEGEKQFLEDNTGPLSISYQHSGLIPPKLETVKNHVDAILNEITLNGNLILVHNTFADKNTIRKIRERKNLFWCLCPNSNLYIENTLPPLDLLINEGCEIVVGTDSLASNTRLSIFEELKTLQSGFPSLTVEELVRWSTINGARALAEDDRFGKIEPGKKPGLLILRNVDLINMRLLPDSYVTRLI
ncbi:MAG TPA: amidohydrolase family protein [Bacteroidales bacterium]|nr:amidohydrolase family protein [Bacteroidales bacterium]HPT20386.1 amidohydrolase family protein [Bacteroidales bacterium]